MLALYISLTHLLTNVQHAKLETYVLLLIVTVPVFTAGILGCFSSGDIRADDDAGTICADGGRADFNDRLILSSSIPCSLSFS